MTWIGSTKILHSGKRTQCYNTKHSKYYSIVVLRYWRSTPMVSEPHVYKRKKKHVGVIQDSNAEQATLHHEVLYRVQDHALDLNLPNTTGEALFMFIDNVRGPAIVNIPRMITTDELSSIIPLEWITDYEKAFPKEQFDIH
ncbi:hypothetical protein AHAS_Ahas19G0226000 [Arachis hypogaea]